MLIILNALLCDAQNQWYEKNATLQEIKGLRDLVESDKVKLSYYDKTEHLSL